MTTSQRILLQFHADDGEIMVFVCRHFGVTLDQLRSKDRHAHIADARHVAMWLLRERGLSFPAIARILHRDHTTVMSGVRKIDHLRLIDRAVAEALDGMKGAA